MSPRATPPAAAPRNSGDDRELASRLGELLLYPGDDYRQRLTSARERCDAHCGSLAAEALTAFESAVAALSLDDLRDLYTRTFDLAPRCVPYLSVHLFGSESFDRARLMTGLDDTYRRAGFDRGSELPDHLGLVLRFATAFDDADWDELVSLCLARPLAVMLRELQEADNPFRHAVEAVRRALGVSGVEAAVPRVPLWRRRRAEKGGAP